MRVQMCEPTQRPPRARGPSPGCPAGGCSTSPSLPLRQGSQPELPAARPQPLQGLTSGMGETGSLPLGTCCVAGTGQADLEVRGAGSPPAAWQSRARWRCSGTACPARCRSSARRGGARPTRGAAAPPGPPGGNTQAGGASRPRCGHRSVPCVHTSGDGSAHHHQALQSPALQRHGPDGLWAMPGSSLSPLSTGAMPGATSRQKSLQRAGHQGFR